MKQITAQYQLQTSLFLNTLEKITEQESNLIIDTNLNPIKWVAGHIVNTRMTLLFLLSGKQPNEKFQKQFGKGSSPANNEHTPSLNEIKELWESVSMELIEALHNQSEEKLQSPPPFQTSIPDNTFLGLIAYLAIHEAHHLGQLSILKVLVNK